MADERHHDVSDSRRTVLQRGTALLVGSLLVPATAFAAESKEDVSPPEDLMREHGVLDRILLIYEAGLHNFANGESFDPAVLHESADIVRSFIENYHEKSEEEDVFPRFRKANKLTALVDTLQAQHDAGRRLTDIVLRDAARSAQAGDERRRTVGAITQFIRMYRPHAAREDTSLFPKLKDLVSSNEYDAMAERFERKEHELFGADGFEKMVDRVERLERKIGLYDLAQFTPR